MQKVKSHRRICPCLPNTVSCQLPLNQETKHLPFSEICDSASWLQQLAGPRSFQFIMQRVSVAVQLRKAACIIAGAVG